MLGRIIFVSGPYVLCSFNRAPSIARAPSALRPLHSRHVHLIRCHTFRRPGKELGRLRLRDDRHLRQKHNRPMLDRHLYHISTMAKPSSLINRNLVTAHVQPC